MNFSAVSAVSALDPVGSQHGHSLTQSGRGTKIAQPAQMGLLSSRTSGDVTPQTQREGASIILLQPLPKICHPTPPTSCTLHIFHHRILTSLVVQESSRRSEVFIKIAKVAEKVRVVGDKKKVQPRRIELLPHPWQGCMIPFHHSCYNLVFIR